MRYIQKQSDVFRNDPADKGYIDIVLCVIFIVKDRKDENCDQE